MRYPIEQYDKHGFLKVPSWLWLGWIFLAKAWVVFVVAGVSRESGAKLLEIIYPVRDTLYIGLAMGFPAILMMWLIGLRHPDRRWVFKTVQYGRVITLLLVLGQLWLVGYQIVLERGVFNWSHAITFVALLWFLLFLFQSKRVKACFTELNLDSE